jgi:hypothetical protein
MYILYLHIYFYFDNLEKLICYYMLRINEKAF